MHPHLVCSDKVILLFVQSGGLWCSDFGHVLNTVAVAVMVSANSNRWLYAR